MEVQTAPTSLHSQQSLQSHAVDVREHEHVPHEIEHEHVSHEIEHEHVSHEIEHEHVPHEMLEQEIVDNGHGHEHEQPQEDYQLTELKNMSSESVVEDVNNIRMDEPLEELIEDESRQSNSQATSTQNVIDDDLQLAHAVSQHPCLFDPSDDYYGSKQSSAEYRCNVWTSIAKELQWNGDLHCIQIAWKRLRDRFVRRVKRNNEDALRGISHENEPDRQLMDALQWLHPFISISTSETKAANNISVSAPSTSSGTSEQQQNGEPYYTEPQTMGHDVMISGYQHQSGGLSERSPQQQPTRVVNQQQSHNSSMGNHQQQQPELRGSTGSSTGYYIVRNPNGTGGQAIRIVNNAHGDANNAGNSSGQSSSNAPRITVVPTSRGGGTVLHLQPGGQAVNLNRSQQRVHIIHTPASSTHPAQFEQRIVGPSEPGVTVTASGNAGMIGSVKKDQSGNPMSMIIDPTPYFHNGTQKLYRLVNVADLQDGSSSGMSGPPRKRMAIVARPQQQQQQQQQNMGGHVIQQQNMSMPSSSNNRSNNVNQMGNENIIEDGIQERTIVIDQDANGPDSPLLSDSPGIGSMMISGHQSMHPRHHQSSVMGQQRGMMQPQSHHQMHHQQDPMTDSPGPHPGYLQQSQYDADLQFQQLISTSLSRYDDDTKAMMKFNIQRILLEARYGSGMCLRMMQEEEQEMADTAGGVAHDIQGSI